MIHFSDVVDYNPDDPLKKLCEYIDELSLRFRENYTPNMNLAVDEYLSLWKGRLSFKIYIPTKRERYGIKIFMMCESESAYLSEFIIYTASSTDYGTFKHPLPQSYNDLKSPTKVVLKLLEFCINKGYSVTVDNYYTSPELAKALLSLQTDCYGTLRKKKTCQVTFGIGSLSRGTIQ